MIEFRGFPVNPDRKYDKTGFFILWPLAAFPFFAWPVALISNPKECLADPMGTGVMFLGSMAWTAFWGTIPVLARLSDVAEAKRIANSRITIDDIGIKFNTVKSVVSMPWSEIQSIKIDHYSEDDDILFKTKWKTVRYEHWLDNEQAFLDEVRRHFPDTDLT